MEIFKKFDKWLLGALVLLLVFGVWMMSSVSVFNSYEKETYAVAKKYCTQHFTTENRSYCMENEGAQIAELFCTENNCNDLYLSRQLKNLFIALVVMSLAFAFPFIWYKIFSPVIFLGAFLLLLLTLFADQSGGATAKSWLNIPLVGSFQTSEIMKMALVLYTSAWMEKKKQEVKTLANGFIPFAILVILSTILVMIQPDFGSTAILLLIATAIFWVAGGHYLHFLYAGGLGVLLIVIAANSFAYVGERINTFLHPEEADKDAFHQLEQSYLSIGNGGMFGQGSSTQSFGFLPEIQGDMIFAAIAEQVGFIGMIFVVGLYVFIIIRGIQISKNAPDRFSMLVAAGITAWFGTQSLINMMVVTGLFPLTGITLPLLSYGGSSLLMTLASMGILLRISTLSNAYTSRRRRNSRTSFSFGRHR